VHIAFAQKMVIAGAANISTTQVLTAAASSIKANSLCQHQAQ
jgi:hypothetical protein